MSRTKRKNISKCCHTGVLHTWQPEQHNQTWRHRLLRKEDRAQRRNAMQREDYDVATQKTYVNVSRKKNGYILNY